MSDTPEPELYGDEHYPIEDDTAPCWDDMTELEEVDEDVAD